jgi:hypothetical protein
MKEAHLDQEKVERRRDAERVSKYGTLDSIKEIYRGPE